MRSHRRLVLTIRPVVTAVIAVLTAAVLDGAQKGSAPAAEADVFGFENEHVRVCYGMFEAAPADRRSDDGRPIVRAIHVNPGPGVVTPGPVLPPRGARPSWRPGVMPRAVYIEVRSPPPGPPALGLAGADPPRGTREESTWPGGRLLIATFRPLHYGDGTGEYPSVATFLSDGVIEISSRGLRSRMGVQAGDAFWFEAGTRIVVVDDYPIGAAIVQFLPGR